MSGPKVLVVQHEDDCPPAWFGTWLTEAGCDLDIRCPYAGDPLPADLSGHDALLVLGGPMGANDDARFGWLAQVKVLVREAAAAGVPTLGICLGHQLVAVALGGEVVVNPLGQQVGVLALGWTDDARDDVLLGSLPSCGIQWNDDVVSIVPEGATVLARTDAGELQAARFAPTVWGVQPHPEADGSVVRPWADDDRTRLGDQRTTDLLADLAAARAELDAAWRPVARTFAAMAHPDTSPDKNADAP